MIQTGQEFVALGMHEIAEGCFAKATHYIPLLRNILLATTEECAKYEIASTIYELYTDRASNAAALQQKVNTPAIGGTTGTHPLSNRDSSSKSRFNQLTN